MLPREGQSRSFCCAILVSIITYLSCLLMKITLFCEHILSQINLIVPCYNVKTSYLEIVIVFCYTVRVSSQISARVAAIRFHLLLP